MRGRGRAESQPGQAFGRRQGSLNTVKAIILDIGGVLWFPAGLPLRDKWAVKCGKSPEEFDRLVYHSELGEKSLIGAISAEEMWDTVGSVLGLSGLELDELK